MPKWKAPKKPSYHPYARAKSPLKFSHEAFSGKTMDAGAGLKFHEFSNISFDATTHVDPKASRDTYVKDTGLTPIPTTQDWGIPSPPVVPGNGAVAPLEEPKMYRSRRGSIAGLAPMPDGSVRGWRLHSLPTSESLRDKTVKSSSDFKDIFDTRAELLTKSAVNSKNKEQSVNAVLSDVGKVRYDSTKDAFDLTDVTHAMGVSGKGMDNKASSSPQDIYAPSIEVAKKDGKSGSAAQTYHSEPMAITLHNGSRTAKLENESGVVGIFASFPNQVCFQCGRMFQEKVGKNAVVTGVPGRPFGGQKEGDTFSPITGTTVTRAAPMTQLRTDTINAAEVGHIYDYHHRT